MGLTVRWSKEGEGVGDCGVDTMFSWCSKLPLMASSSPFRLRGHQTPPNSEKLHADALNHGAGKMVLQIFNNGEGKGKASHLHPWIASATRVQVEFHITSSGHFSKVSTNWQ
ncbi:hypothetical protein OPV22_026842 [Ensete ventricosum]|uniref:Uncharacterized protein n=1 Tax=Ensete ventricosum TaxID=4639 RepID=A0AAV8PY90_ENSVE|nr:hypothetical protein OPV22_026842 [Ensete ventricosum]